jgi:hypothetical protein
MISPRWYLFLRWYLWVAPNLLLVPCLFGLLRRRIYRPFPLFVAFVAAQLALFVTALFIVLTIANSPSYMLMYRRVVIADVGTSGLLGLGVMYELADKLIATRTSLKPVMQHLMRWTVAFLILIAALSTALIPQSGIEQIMKVFQVLDFSSNLVKLGLLLVLVGFSRVLRVSWRSLPAGIALGFAVSAAAEMAAAPLFSALGLSYYQRLDLIRTVGFHICVLIWLIYIFLPGKPPTFTGHRPDRTDVEAWDHELQKMVR